MGGGSTSLGSGASIPGTTPGVAGSGVLSATTMGRGPGRPAAGIVRLRDVGRVELGAQNYSLGSTFDGHPAVGLAIFQLPGTNALDVAGRIRAKMEELKADFPEGVDYAIAYDTTPFIRESVADVVQTLLEAVMLVAIVVLVFLQNWRAALIPLVAVPVAIVGTFAVMAALGFSLNNVSLFGLVLAIGIVVDDAIVVVENVERWLEQGLPPREAARRAMDEVTGPVIAVALVLCAVFVPCAFLSGITGQFFRQFAVTIAVSTVISAFNSLTLSPALAAILLKPHGARRDPLTWLLDLLLGWFFRLFNWAFGKGTAGYGWVVGRLLRGSVLVVLAYAGLLVLTGWVFRGAHGLHPATGSGPDHLQHPVARLGLAPADSGGGGPNRGDRPPDGGRGPHDHDLGHIVRAAGQQPQFCDDVRRPGAVREAAQPRPDRHRRHRPAAGGLGPRDQGRPGDRLRGAGDPGPQRRGRLQAHGRGPGRPRAGGLAAPD